MRPGPLVISVAPALKSVENITVVVVCCWPFGSLWFSRLSEYVIGHCWFGIRAYKRNAKVNSNSRQALGLGVRVASLGFLVHVPPA